MIQHIDRVPTKPNRYAVYDDDHNFLRYEYHERADEPTQEGNPINKVLQDEFLAASGTTAGTGAALTLSQTGFSLFVGASVRIKLHTELGSNPTLNVNGTGNIAIKTVSLDAPSGIGADMYMTLIYNGAYWILQGGDSPYKIGDKRFTVNPTPRDSELLCNGDRITAADYPLLTPLLPEKANNFSYLLIVSDSYRVCTGIAFNGTYYVATLRVTSGTANVYKFYATSLAGPWTANGYVAARTSYSDIQFPTVIYVNGFFIITDVVATYPYLHYCIDPSGSWTSIKLSSSTTQTTINNVIYENGNYITVTVGDSYPVILYQASLIASWGVYNLTAYAGYTAYDILYLGGYYIIPVSSSSDSGFLYSASLTSGWQYKQITDTNIGSCFIDFLNGKFIVTVSGLYVYSSTSLLGSYTLMASLSTAIYKLRYYNGKYFAKSGANFAVSVDLVVWNYVYASEGTTYVDGIDIRIVGEHFVFFGKSGGGQGNYVYLPIATDMSNFKLPTDATDEGYVFIKAQ